MVHTKGITGTRFLALQRGQWRQKKAKALAMWPEGNVSTVQRG